jgi:hypothetical protein
MNYTFNFMGITTSGQSEQWQKWQLMLGIVISNIWVG